MEQQKIDMFLAQNAEKLPKDKIMLLQDALTKLDDSKAMFIHSIEFKDPTTILIISILIGSLGIDRFMLGEAGLGIAKLLTCGGCYIWWIIDMVNATDRTRQYNYKKLQEALAKLDDSKAMFIHSLDFKDPTTILIISILIGAWGVDRFMLGETGLGIAKLLTCGGCYIWWIIDMVNATDRTRQYNYKKLQDALMMQGITIY